MLNKRFDDRPFDSLSARFSALWARCAGNSARPESVFEDLLRRYSEPIRRYHEGSHIVHCLVEFDRAADGMKEPDAVELALWFHDAVYVPGALDNEQRSAELLSQRAGNFFSAALVSRIGQFILATRHIEPPQPGDEAYVVDIDLSSFGMDWRDFIRDGVKLRRERPDLEDAEYYPCHARFLKSLLARPRIYHTGFFRERYEESARRNITRLLASKRYADSLSAKNDLNGIQ